MKAQLAVLSILFLSVPHVLCAGEYSPRRDERTDSLTTRQESRVWCVRALGGLGRAGALSNGDVLVAGHSEEQAPFSGIEVERVLIGGLGCQWLDVVGKVTLTRHFERDRQPDFNEYIGDIGLRCRRLPWTTWIRSSVSIYEGLSYCERIPTVVNGGLRTSEMDRLNDESRSHLLNHLGVSLSLNLRDCLRVLSGGRAQAEVLEPWQWGVGLTHRSGIFGLMNGAKGETNYPYVFAQRDF